MATPMCALSSMGPGTKQSSWRSADGPLILVLSQDRLVDCKIQLCGLYSPLYSSLYGLEKIFKKLVRMEEIVTGNANFENH